MALGDKTEHKQSPRASLVTHWKQTGGRSCSRAMQPQGWAPWQHPPAKHSPYPVSSATLGTQAPAPTCCPTQPPHLEIGLAIKARCSDITGPINAAGGQKYQVTGEGLICFHFYYVSNLGERKYLHGKSSQ